MRFSDKLQAALGRIPVRSSAMSPLDLNVIIRAVHVVRVAESVALDPISIDSIWRHDEEIARIRRVLAEALEDSE